MSVPGESMHTQLVCLLSNFIFHSSHPSAVSLSLILNPLSCILPHSIHLTSPCSLLKLPPHKQTLWPQNLSSHLPLLSSNTFSSVAPCLSKYSGSLVFLCSFPFCLFFILLSSKTSSKRWTDKNKVFLERQEREETLTMFSYNYKMVDKDIYRMVITNCWCFLGA